MKILLLTGAVFVGVLNSAPSEGEHFIQPTSTLSALTMSNNAVVNDSGKDTYEKATEQTVTLGTSKSTPRVMRDEMLTTPPPAMSTPTTIMTSTGDLVDGSAGDGTGASEIPRGLGNDTVNEFEEMFKSETFQRALSENFHTYITILCASVVSFILNFIVTFGLVRLGWVRRVLLKPYWNEIRLLNNVDSTTARAKNEIRLL